MILLKELKLNNFLSHENTSIVFDESEKVLIDGRSGSGKSSIADAILWALYGKGRADNRSLIRRGNKSASVHLKLVDGLTETLITRSVSSTGKNVLTVTQKKSPEENFLPIQTTGLKDTQNWIETELLKASYELFTNSIAYPQENENSFVKASASRRKDLLLEIVRAANFDDIYEKARKMLSQKETENAVSLSNIDSLKRQLKDLTELSSKYPFYKESYDGLVAQIEPIILKEKEVERVFNSISHIAKDLEEKRAFRKTLDESLVYNRDQHDRNVKEVEEHNKIDILSARNDVAKAEELSKEADDIQKELQQISLSQMVINNHLANRPHVTDYSSEIDTINKRLIPLIQDSGKCPAGDGCPFIIPIKGQIDFLTEQITEKTLKGEQEKAALEKWEKEYVQITPTKDSTELYLKLNSLRGQVNALSVSKDIVTKYELFSSRRSQLEADEKLLSSGMTTILANIKETDEWIKKLEQDLALSNPNTINAELSNIRTTLFALQKQREEASVNMALALKAQEDFKTVSTEVEAIRVSIDKVQEDITALEMLKAALGTSGVKAVVIDYLVPQLEDRINTVLGQMSDFTIRLDTQKATADEEGVKEGLFITVINDLQEELSFDSYSGGEKVKITIAISEALASLQGGIGFRIMDENIVSLDRESTEGFVEVLTKLQEKFPQLLVISHLQEVKDMFEKQILIIKVNGASKIK